jgi:predicted RNA-binding Zn-ribbon protein involved in translation (DUF1610 family)
MSWTTFYPSDVEFEISSFIVKFKCPACGKENTIIVHDADYWMYGREVVCQCGSTKFSIDVRPRFVVQTDNIK